MIVMNLQKCVPDIGYRSFIIYSIADNIMHSIEPFLKPQRRKRKVKEKTSNEMKYLTYKENLNEKE